MPLRNSSIEKGTNSGPLICVIADVIGGTVGEKD